MVTEVSGADLVSLINCQRIAGGCGDVCSTMSLCDAVSSPGDVRTLLALPAGAVSATIGFLFGAAA